MPRPGVERLLLGKQGTPVMLSNLKSLSFRGVSAYLERLISQIRAPVLRVLSITLFNQLAFTLTHLSQFVNITEQIKFPHTATIAFLPGDFITLSHHAMMPRAPPSQGFTLHVMCKPLDWQIDCAAQICTALMSALSGVERLTLFKISGYSLATSDSETNETDYTTYDPTWPELLRSFVSVKELYIDPDFIVELSRALEVDERGLDPELLPNLQGLASDSPGIMDAESLFGSFLHARQVAGRPVSWRPPSPPLSPGLPS